MEICLKLLKEWCEKLLELQIHGTGQPTLDGGILCPACARVHGRCFDAIYPFLYLADKYQDNRYLEGAKALFDWAENTVLREDGSYVNDTSGPWKGITVFSVIQLIEALEYHGHLLDYNTKNKWENRIRKAADFLCNFKEFEVCNVNYRITNSLAMALCGEFFDDNSYRKRSVELAEMAEKCISETGLLIGEGRPVDGVSKKGCRPVDIGYNMEESLPSFTQYAFYVGDEKKKKLALKALKIHLKFMLEDGGIDNSFGTRNYKWTYWGSRTSDGCLMAYLMASELESDLAFGAYKNLMLLEKCTKDGFLYGGPHMWEKGELPCIHHGFSHAKVLAGILDRGLETRFQDGILPRTKMEKPEYWKELDTYLIPGDGWTATVTGYDWEYLKLPGGHASGGTISLLRDQKAGLILCAGMSHYTLKEAANMQLPLFEKHECITPRLEVEDGGIYYSSMFDYGCKIYEENLEDRYYLHVKGNLKDENQNTLENGTYEFHYEFHPKKLSVCVKTTCSGTFVLPIISKRGEEVKQKGQNLCIEKNKKNIQLEVLRGIMELPYGETERIYNLVPGVEALKITIKPEKGEIDFCMLF